MKVLIDGTPLSAGGGVQAAIALLVGMRGCPQIAWRAVMSAQTRVALGAAWAGDERVAFVRKDGWRDFWAINRALHEAEAVFAPDVVFTVFGPAYFRARAPHVCGFARPRMIYNDASVRGVAARGASPTPRWEAQPPRPTRFGDIKFGDIFRARSLRRMDHVILETEIAAERVIARLGISRQRVSVIANGVNPIFMEFAPGPILEMGRRVILVPSAYYRHKNLEIIPAIAEELLRREPGLDFEFRLTLEAASPEWLGIARDAELRGVGGRVVTAGVLTLAELAAAYGAAWVVMLPTLMEISTAVYPEAFHMRRPMVTSDRAFAHGLCGDAALYADPLDADGFADAIARVLRDDELRERLVAAGRVRLAEAYPSPGEKFAAQMALLMKVAGRV